MCICIMYNTSTCTACMCTCVSRHGIMYDEYNDQIYMKGSEPEWSSPQHLIKYLSGAERISLGFGASFVPDVM